MNTEQSYVGKGCHANPSQQSAQNEPTNQQSPRSDLEFSLPISVNSLGGSVTPEAKIVYTALREYRQKQLRYLLNQHAMARETGHGYDDAAGVWEEIEQVEQLQTMLLNQLIELAEQNYRKAQQLERPDHTQHFAERQEELLQEYIDEFKIAIR
ncbi:hypothetical protein [Spirosoma gilvum]